MDIHNDDELDLQDIERHPRHHYQGAAHAGRIVDEVEEAHEQGRSRTEIA